ncbi:MAG: nucleotidyltransferase family protein [Elusimicrobia bacterium]|nr:nucleotidyltransferase family protein [Elusimicrobiota bacterium]
MKAMILAAGRGTRLKPLTDSVPKALVEVGGVTMLETVIRRLISAGADSLVINVHHLHHKILSFLAEKEYFGLHIDISPEIYFPLETGGGLKKAACFFDDGKPFFMHNADVFTDLDLSALYAAHVKSGALATLAVKKRPSARQLLFDDGLNLKGKLQPGADPGKLTQLAFSGVQVISPDIFGKMTESGVFSITDVYLRLAGEGEKIMGFRNDACYWQDIGSVDKLENLRRHVKSSK